MRHQRKSPAFKFINSPWKSSVRGGITAKLLLTYQLCTNCQPWRLGVGSLAGRPGGVPLSGGLNSGIPRLLAEGQCFLDFCSAP